MSLPQVLLPSPTSHGMDEWMFAHYQHHLAIVEGVQRKFKVHINVPMIWPVNPQNIQVWLEAHQLLHNETNAVLKIPGNDLSAINWEDEKQRQGFFFLNFQEHKAAATNVGPPAI